MRQGMWVLAALALGLALGIAAADFGPPMARQAVEALAVIGSVWLDALRMTLVPLIFCILVAAIATVSDAATTGPLARRALILFGCVIIGAGAYSIFASEALLALWPVDPSASAALTAAVQPDAEAPKAAPVDFAQWLHSLVPTNVVAAAAEDAVLPVVVFACLFGFAVARLPEEKRTLAAGVFQAMGDAMIILVQWVLMLAPIGVFGLAASLGLQAGASVLGALAHYVAIVSLVTIGIILIAGVAALVLSRRPPLETLRAIAPVQVIAASTQSSLASLPAMLTAALGPLGVRPHVGEFVLPLAVAVFRLTSPVANLAVVMFLAHLYGVEPNPAQYVAGIAVAFVVSVSSVGLPGQTSFFTSVAPICLAMGVPVELLPVLLAVEMIPDVFRTIGNVTGDLTATLALDRKR